MNRTEWNDVTIFISSTFNDMHAERDYLVKYVFPELREWCAKRKLRLNDIDLRWGITLSDSQTSRTLGICLRDIDRSRPYFLGFLGQRKGWQPDVTDIDEETRNEYPQLPDRVRISSVTEIEIEHALLAPMIRIANEKKIEPEAARHAFIFLRDDTFTDKLSPAQKRIYTNQAEAAAGEDPEHSERVLRADQELETLRRKLEEKVPCVRHYQAEFHPEIPTPELGGSAAEEGRGRLTHFEVDGTALREVILEDFRKAILEDYPDRREELPESSEEDIRELYIDRMAAGYIERPADLSAVGAFIDAGKDSNILILHSPSGAGKTTLMAEVYRRYSQRGGMRVLIRFCGVGNDNSTVYGVFSGIFHDLGIPCPPDMAGIQENIGSLFGMIREDRTVILIDALDQIPGGPEILRWLPGNLPDRVRVVLSIRTDLLTGILAPAECVKRGASLYQLQPFDRIEDKQALVDGYLRSHLKQLESDLLDMLFARDASSNPLYLLAAVSELRLVGRIELLQSHIEHLGDDPEELFDTILQRMEEEYLSEEIDSKKTVSLLCSLISVSRYGLSKEELEGIFREAFPEADRNDLNAQIQVYLRQLREFTLQCGTITDFRYNALRRAASRRYQAIASASHTKIADYFIRQMGPSFENADQRSANEVVYHLINSEAPERGFHLLTEIRFLKKRLALSGVSALIGDYEYAWQCSSLPPLEREQAMNTEDALRRAAYILAEKPDELAGQLAMRLSRFPGSDAFLDRIRGDTQGIWLRTVSVEEGISDYTLLLKNQDDILGIYACRDGIVKAGADGSVMVLSDQDGSLKRMIREKGGKFISSCQAGDRLYLTDDHGTVLVCRISTGSLICSADLKPDNNNHRPVFPVMAADRDVLILADDKGNVISADPETLKIHAVRSRRETRGAADCIFLMPDGEYRLDERNEVLLSGRSGKVQICNKYDLSEIRSFDPDIGAVTALYADSESIYLGSYRNVIVRMSRDGRLLSGRSHQNNNYVCSIRRIKDRILTFSGEQAFSYSTDLAEAEQTEGIFQSVRLLTLRNENVYFVTADQYLGYMDASIIYDRNRLSSSASAAGLCVGSSHVLMWYDTRGIQAFDRRTGRALPADQGIDNVLENETVLTAAPLNHRFLAGTRSGKLLEITPKGELVSTCYKDDLPLIFRIFIFGKITPAAVKRLASSGNRAVYMGGGNIFLHEGDREKMLYNSWYMGWNPDAIQTDGEYCYTAFASRLTLRTIPGGKKVRSFKIQNHPKKLAFNHTASATGSGSPNDRFSESIAAGYQDSILVYDLEKGSRMGELFHGRCLDFDVRGDLLAAALEDKTIRVYRGGVFQCMLTLDDIPGAICFDPDSDVLYAGTGRGSLVKISIENTQETAKETVQETTQDQALPEPPRTENTGKIWKFRPARVKEPVFTKPALVLCSAAILLFCVLGRILCSRAIGLGFPERDYFLADFHYESVAGVFLYFITLPLLLLEIALQLICWGGDELSVLFCAAWLIFGIWNICKHEKHRSAEYMLPSYLLQAMSSIAYWMIMRSFPAGTAESASSVFVMVFLAEAVWFFLWAARMIGLWKHTYRRLSKKHELFGPESCFRVKEQWMNRSARMSAMVMIALSLVRLAVYLLLHK